MDTTPEQLACPLCGKLHRLSASQDGEARLCQCENTGVTFALESTDTSPDQTSGAKSETDGDVTLVADTLPGGASGALTGDRPSVLYQLATQYHSDQEADPAGAGVHVSRDRYCLERRIAAGGMGSVQLTRDNDLNRHVALKTILPPYQESRRSVARFIREAQTVGQLEHPNIVPIYDVGMGEDDTLYFTMRYVRGQTLGEVIRRLSAGDSAAHQQFTWTRRANIIQHVCDALEFAHRRGVVHRDLKPDNIMVGQFGEVLVLDWGISTLSPGDASESLDPSSSDATDPVEITELPEGRTYTGAVVGTPQYMSPEQARADGSVGPASDIYALGAVMYSLFGLQPAHAGETVKEILAAVRDSSPPRVDSLRNRGQGTVPIEIHYIVSKAMDKQPKERYASAAEMKDDIQRFIEGTYPIRCPHTALKRAVMALGRLVDSHARLIIVAMLMAISVLLGVLFMWVG